MYRIWIKGKVGLVSPSPDFSGTKEQAEAEAWRIEQQTPSLEGLLEVVARSRSDLS